MRLQRLQISVQREYSIENDITILISGNHELWLRQTGGAYCHENSIAKFHAIVALCDTIGVHTRPIRSSAVTIPRPGLYQYILGMPNPKTTWRTLCMLVETLKMRNCPTRFGWTTICVNGLRFREPLLNTSQN